MLFADVDIGGEGALIDDRGVTCGTSTGPDGVCAA